MRGGLPSWRDTPTRAAILDFVDDVSRSLPAEERVAVFDNDGTLWTEKPMPVQLHFIVERWRTMATADPSLAERQPYTAAAGGDLSWLAAAVDKHYAGDDADMKELVRGVVESQAGIEVGAFAGMVEDFLATARHPTLGTPFSHVVYQPMRELLDHLGAHGFRVFLTSGGDRDFMRPFSEAFYGVPPEAVIGSALGLEYREGDGGGAVVYGPSFSFLDDGPEKPVRIWSRLGRRPVLAAGNSNGDIPMLSFVEGHERHLALLVHHDDPDRGDLPYDKGAETALAEARKRAWTVVSVRDDWETVFPS